MIIDPVIAEDNAVAEALRHYRRIITGIIAVTAIVVVVLVLSIGAMVVRLNHISNDAIAQRQILVDCTTPGHACYEAAVQQQADVVAKLVDEIRLNRSVGKENQDLLNDIKELIQQEGK